VLTQSSRSTVLNLTRRRVSVQEYSFRKLRQDLSKLSLNLLINRLPTLLSSLILVHLLFLLPFLPVITLNLTRALRPVPRLLQQRDWLELSQRVNLSVPLLIHRTRMLYLLSPLHLHKFLLNLHRSLTQPSPFNLDLVFLRCPSLLPFLLLSLRRRFSSLTLTSRLQHLSVTQLQSSALQLSAFLRRLIPQVRWETSTRPLSPRSSSVLESRMYQE